MFKKWFGLVHTPSEVIIEDKTTKEQLKLIAELEDKDKHVIFSMIDTMLTKKKFIDFFNKNAALV